MRAHVITDGVVSNTVEVDSLDVIPGLIDADLFGGGIGDSWDGLAITPLPPPPPVVPQSVEMRQARLELFDAGLLDDVEAVIAAAGRAAQIEWEFAQRVERSHPLIAIVQQQNGLTDDQIDEMFIRADAR